MNTIKLGQVAAVCVAAYAAALPAGAQQQAGDAQQGQQRQQAQQLQPLDESATPTPEVPTPQKPRTVVTEKRAYGGTTTEIQVQSGRSTYYVQPYTPGSSAMPGGQENYTNRAPQWRIGGFDLKRGDDTKNAAEAAAVTPPPPQPPAAPPQK